MTDAVSTAPRTALWNKDAPLRVLIIENSEADAALNLHELTRGGFRCQSQLIATREELLKFFPRFAFDIVLADYPCPIGTEWMHSPCCAKPGAIPLSFW